MPILIQVALPLPQNRLYTYALPEELLPAPGFLKSDLVGIRVLVPFGKRTLTGVIVESEGVEAVEGIREIFELLDERPIFTPSMLNFTKWIADYYLASWGETLKAALPQGMSPQSVLFAEILIHMSDEEIAEMARRAPKRAALLKELMNYSGAITVGHLEQQLNSESISAQLEALERQGIIRSQRVVSEEVHAKTQKAIRLAPQLAEDNDELREILDDLDSSAPKQALVLSHLYLHGLHNQTPMLSSELLKATKASASALSALVNKGFAIEFEAEVIRREKGDPYGNTLVQREEGALQLTIEQDHAVQKILEGIEAETFKTFLLHGVTGSGKTLVYVQAIREILVRGKSALLLVPEISLTPQLIDRFKAIFGEDIAVMHSKLSQGERFDMWREIQAGRMRIVIGARSAVFAPLKNLGLIIVDEEHEPSYKQEAPAPRYNARDCAIMRGSFEKAVIVLGSATPSIESMFNAYAGKYHLLEIQHRADGAKLPDIHIVDLKQARKKKELTGSFTHELIDAITERIAKKEGVILFQNRRGFSRWLECYDCGAIPKCQNCSVSLTYHKYRHQLQCHYCGFTVPAHKACVECGNPEMNDVGAGTQRVEEELAGILKKKGISATIQRMDLDTTRKKGSHRKILQAFANGDIDILVGTQMVAKGLDFSRVTLVGVINADLQLYVPDFRSAERTYQLLTQVSGRAGRSSELTGEVLVQTGHPDHQAILAAQAAQYDIFYNDELQMRKEAMYPPFSRFVVIEFTGLNEAQVDEHSHLFARLIPENFAAVKKIGPTVPTLPRLRTKWRRVLVLKDVKQTDASGQQLRGLLAHAMHQYSERFATGSIKVTVDIDSYAGI
ncbi:MAG: primosomal protein N' [Bacteroidota bacterium]